MDFSALLQALSQSQGGGSPGGQGGQGGNPLTANWVLPRGSGMSAYNPNSGVMLPLHNSGILQSVLSEPSGPAGGGMNGLQALLMRLGAMK
jgi:hypothetical protein